MVVRDKQKSSQNVPLARLEGTVVLPDRQEPLNYLMRSTTLVIGRSDPNTLQTHPFKPVKKDGVHLGIGISPKLSRVHAEIIFNPSHNTFSIKCHGRNGFTLATDSSSPGDKITPDSSPQPLSFNTHLRFAGCHFNFLPPNDRPPKPPRKPSLKSKPSSSHPRNSPPHHASRPSSISQPASSPKPHPEPDAHSDESPTAKRKRRDWIKTELVALRAQMMRFGYGRWDSIISAATGRLSERHPHELVPVARRFIALCHEHARPGAERKALWDILQRHPKYTLRLDNEAVDADVNSLINSVKDDVEAGEQRKFVRWARKLRILSRLNDIIDHRSLKMLRSGKLKVFTPPPTLYWTSQDDADLIVGSYRHGYGACELMRNDPNLGFLGRYSKAPPSRKPGTPSKTNKPAATNGRNASDDEDDDDDEEADEDEDDRPHSPHGDEESSPEGGNSNPRKRFKLGDGSAKKEDTKSEPMLDADADDFDPSPHHSASGNGDVKAMNDDSSAIKEEPTDADQGKKKFRIIPKKGPRIGNEDGFNNPEDAKAAHEKMADEKGLVPFPNSEALMRRLKSIINSCSKLYDRDMRERRKKEEAENKAKRRRDDLAERKAIKEAEKTRQRAERRAAKSQPFSKKEAVDFEKALANFGVSYLKDSKTVDWAWFHKKVEGYDAKYDETMCSAYIELLGEAHRIRDLAAAKEDEDYETVENINEQKRPSNVFNTLTFDRAERLIERLQFFRTLRGEVLPHPKLQLILKGFKKTKDLPEWWKSCHDRCLLLGVDKYGLNGFEEMGKDPKLSFLGSMRLYQRKNGMDGKSSKRASMPKASAGWKRAYALVQYFQSRANDPHFEIYTQGDTQSAAPSGESNRRASIGNGISLKEDAMEVDTNNDLVRASQTSHDDESSKPSRSRKSEPVLASLRMNGRQRSQRRTLLQIPRDENGSLILPFGFGDGLYLLSLGNVDGGYLSAMNDMIYPIGYRSVRQMASYCFLCEIMKGKDDERPAFRVSELIGFNGKSCDEEEMWDDQQIIASGSHLSAVWMKAVNERLVKDHHSKLIVTSGAERFGLYEPTIVYHIQKLPGAKYVEGYLWRDFTRLGGGGRVPRTVGVFDSMMKALDLKLEPRDDGLMYDEIATDDESNPRYGAVLAEEYEFSIPEDWITEYRDSRKKVQNRRAASYWSS